MATNSVEGKYEPYKLRKRQNAAELRRPTAALHNVNGMDINKRNNMYFIESDRIVYATGNCVVFQNIWTKAKEYLLGLECNGVGCVAIHPSKKYLAVGGVGHFPKIYIYSYPELKVRLLLLNNLCYCFCLFLFFFFFNIYFYIS